MKLNAYTMYDKKIGVYGSIQFTKDNPKDLAVTYERQAIKEFDSIKKCKDNVLYFLGTYDDTTGVLTQVEKVMVVDFDNLILDVMGSTNE